jgi:hypothetical protein
VLRCVRPVRASFIASTGSLMKWNVSFGDGALVWVSVVIVLALSDCCGEVSEREIDRLKVRQRHNRFRSMVRLEIGVRETLKIYLDLGCTPVRPYACRRRPTIYSDASDASTAGSPYTPLAFRCWWSGGAAVDLRHEWWEVGCRFIPIGKPDCSDRTMHLFVNDPNERLDAICLGAE